MVGRTITSTHVRDHAESAVLIYVSSDCLFIDQQPRGGCLGDAVGNRSAEGVDQPAREIPPASTQCWSSVFDAGPAMCRRLANIPTADHSSLATAATAAPITSAVFNKRILINIPL